MDEQDRSELYIEINKFLREQRQGSEDQTSEAIPVDPSLELPTPAEQRGEFNTAARVVGYVYTLPLSVICIAGGVTMLSGMGQANEIITQNPELFRNSILLPESLAAAGLAGIVAGSIFVASAAVDTARGLHRIYRHLRPAS